jgi:bifunctional N-acetylglucosamine-1-phosphate-uridyltransferase/glucosamine-1-phosphate-acetyltransferase GlmU-like protein
LRGPILSEVPYPGILIAKARSHTCKDLELVLYPSADAGVFELGVSRLAPGQTYSYLDKTVKADKDGVIRVSVLVEGRTHIHISPTSDE